MKSEKLSTRDLEKMSFETMKKDFGYKNPLSAPRLVKVVVSVGTGKGIKGNKNFNDHVSDRIAKITGQKPAIRKAKKAVASFKTRQGDPIGVVVTLRSKRMYDFLDKLLKVAFPRTKDFRGVNISGVDQLGNMSLGIKEHTIFPEIRDEELKDVFSLGVSIVTTAKSKKEAEEFFKIIGMPFTK
jgi:large subunit ribosomal protein L5